MADPLAAEEFSSQGQNSQRRFMNCIRTVKKKLKKKKNGSKRTFEYRRKESFCNMNLAL